ncbi:hypothetical protein CLV68_2433 [Actinokineospora cianjurensis]|uniref:Uncharacterized protein n=1 Tax=Actinokineospora cianjurensis TaxID=585224 RepID=A0A421BC02_9PSEU|nr:hypothetical protein CLV68_2433 [Actinokineospora cianjurensis]
MLPSRSDNADPAAGGVRDLGSPTPAEFVRERAASRSGLTYRQSAEHPIVS